MSVDKRLTQVYQDSPIVSFDNQSKIVIMSDCHRGQGNAADNFLPNQNIFYASLKHYYKNKFTYFELGDGDELWENRSLKQIIELHSDVFELLGRFYIEGRLHMIAGNHDIVKSKKKFCEKCLGKYYNLNNRREIPLFPEICIGEGMILEHNETGQRIFLVHGHQGDMLNDTLWPLARFMVRYVWSRLELFGVLDPTGAGKNYKKRRKTERRLVSYSDKKHEILIAGHTHRAMFSKPGKDYYFNDGSCINPRCITAIEIVEGKISLVKWSVKTRQSRDLYVEKDILAGPILLTDYIRY